MIQLSAKFDKTGKYFVNFRDGEGKVHSFEISRELYEAFNEFELEDVSYLNEWDRRIEQSEVWDETLDEATSKNVKTLEEEVLYKIQVSDLYRVIESLPAVQKRRLKLYPTANPNCFCVICCCLRRYCIFLPTVIMIIVPLVV